MKKIISIFLSFLSTVWAYSPWIICGYGTQKDGAHPLRAMEC